MFSAAKILFDLLASFTLACNCVWAAPVIERHATRDVFVPPVLYPNARTVWFAEQTHNVTWDASNPPKMISNGALIVLKTADPNSGFKQVTLASNFSLLDGRHEIKVPKDAPSRGDYEIILFGDSGNTSPAFAILAS